MLLQRLCELADRQDPTPSMYKPTRVKWAIQLDGKGKFEGTTSMTGEGQRGERGREMMAPSLVRSVGIRPILMCDRADYVLGIAKEGKDARTKEQHESFVALVRRCETATKEPTVAAVAAFLDAWKPGAKKGLPSTLEPGDVVTFQVEGEFPIDLPAVRSFWAQTTREDATGDAPRMTCLVCGMAKPVERRLPVKITGIPGGQTSGTALISANSDAFYSYGLEESLIAPTCRDCGEKFAKALNGLLADRRSSIRIGDGLAWVFWTRADAGAGSVVDFLADPSPNEVRALLEAPKSGKAASASLNPADFFAVALSGSGGRAVVRDYLETSTADLRENVRRWFRLQLLQGDAGDEPLSVKRLCQALTHDLSKEALPAIPQTLVRVALAGGALPDSLLHLAVRRNRAEQGITRARAVLIKMVLTSGCSCMPGTRCSPKYGFHQEDLTKMDPDNDNPAYLCGRLFAELENAQREALGTTNTTIRDRYFGTASSAPATVFGNLMRGSQAHLTKLRKDRPAACIAIEQRIEEITSRMTTFPPTLSLKDQALFSLGYYHQRAAGRAAAKARKAAKDPDTMEATTDA